MVCILQKVCMCETKHKNYVFCIKIVSVGKNKCEKNKKSKKESKNYNSW
jgi:hypothetical protein